MTYNNAELRKQVEKMSEETQTGALSCKFHFKKNNKKTVEAWIKPRLQQWIILPPKYKHSVVNIFKLTFKTKWLLLNSSENENLENWNSSDYLIWENRTFSEISFENWHIYMSSLQN